MIYRAIEGESIPVVPEALIDDPLVSVDDVVSAPSLHRREREAWKALPPPSSGLPTFTA